MPRPVVLIHGMWCTGANFARIVETLKARGHDCHTPNLPAHELGAEHPEVGNKSLGEYLSSVESYVRAQNFTQPPVLVGHSMGGLLAQQLAARSNPFALVLLTPASPKGIFTLRVSVLIAFLFHFLRWGFWRKPHKPSPGRCAASVYNCTPAQQHARTYATLVGESGWMATELTLAAFGIGEVAAVNASAIKCPVYVVSAGHDKLTPPGVVRQCAALYPQAALRHYPGRGHWVLDDADTDEMTADIANWIQGHEQRAAALARA